MDLNNLKTSSRELTEILELLIKIPEKVSKIDVDIKKELILEINERQSSITNSIAGLISVNSDYPYPENYLPNRLFEYWAERMSKQFTYYELESLKKMIIQSLESIEKPKEEIIDNPFPMIFINGNVYKCFNDYTENNIIDFYIDYSYLKKRLEAEKLIHTTKDIDFIKFLKDDIKLISNKDYDVFLKNDSKLRSLNKSTSGNRENNFNITFKGLF